MRILIVEDDRKLALLIKKGLEENGHSALAAFEGLEGASMGEAGQFDLFILDVMLPKLDGLSIVRRLRASEIDAPILLLTGKDAPDDVVAGLDAGADDYLTKPFSFRVLLARIRALGRRKRVDPRTVFRIGDLMLDPSTHEVTRSGERVSLTRTEFTLLEILAKNAGRVLTRNRLIEAVWGNEREVESNTLDVYIRQLRNKLEIAGGHKLLHTVRGIGYTLREEETA